MLLGGSITIWLVWVASLKPKFGLSRCWVLEALETSYVIFTNWVDLGEIKGVWVVFGARPGGISGFGGGFCGISSTKDGLTDIKEELSFLSLNVVDEGNWDGGGSSGGGDVDVGGIAGGGGWW
ncbi:hypothetical protein Hanom_Chr00s002105g01691751 [Helianthus anomalus]